MLTLGSTSPALFSRFEVCLAASFWEARACLTLFALWLILLRYEEFEGTRLMTRSASTEAFSLEFLFVNAYGRSLLFVVCAKTMLYRLIESEAFTFISSERCSLFV